MNITNLILILLVFTFFNCKPKDKLTPENYIDLIYHKNDNKTLSHISTNIIDKQDDDIGVFIKNHKPRFDYFFGNKLDVETLEMLYPDTLKIKKEFIKQINEKHFVSNFSKLANIKKQTKEHYTIDEIMQVASRFFVVVNSGKTFRIKICAGGNYFQDLNAIKDVSLIEAMTYEAIISAFDKKKSERPKFISNTRTYFSEAIKNPKSLDNNELLKLAENRLYEMMEKDESLKLFIDEYLIINSNNLPFEIKKDN
ncbi:hypothetical protein ACFSKN_00920 [Mariniflexile gromovii]|uniref:Lipoprotein n=1 Tax=Mariniflexile gromovii TaxID=362523 RepID=A0ABS4BS80_9FLAO|nr:hypothetical protein [Mariniflexile gromovii]MBP0903439.1 hypothetical protein [Mariniflexile gromovii]